MSISNLKVVTVMTLTVLSLSACGRGVVDSNIARRNPQTGKVDIVRNYKITHAETSATTMFEANFREGHGTWSADVRLVTPASIKVNGRTLIERSKVDGKDGGEIAAFYLGFIYPPAWIFLGDQGYANYIGKYKNAREFNALFVDAEGESHSDRFVVPSLAAQIPSSSRRDVDLIIPLRGERSFQSVYCAVSMTVRQEVTTKVTNPDGTTSEKKEMKNVDMTKTYFARYGEVRVPTQDLSRSVRDRFEVECGGNNSETLVGGSGGTADIAYIGRKHRVTLR